MIVYSSGTSDDKLKLIFNMYDYDKNGKTFNIPFILECEIVKSDFTVLKMKLKPIKTTEMHFEILV